jgi:hypothetical protein
MLDLRAFGTDTPRRHKSVRSLGGGGTDINDVLFSAEVASLRKHLGDAHQPSPRLLMYLHARALALWFFCTPSIPGHSRMTTMLEYDKGWARNVVCLNSVVPPAGTLP